MPTYFMHEVGTVGALGMSTHIEKISFAQAELETNSWARGLKSRFH